MSSALSVIFMILYKTTGYEVAFSFAAYACLVVACIGFVARERQEKAPLQKRINDLENQIADLKSSPGRKAIRLQVEYYIKELENLQKIVATDGTDTDKTFGLLCGVSLMHIQEYLSKQLPEYGLFNVAPMMNCEVPASLSENARQHYLLLQAKIVRLNEILALVG